MTEVNNPIGNPLLNGTPSVTGSEINKTSQPSKEEVKLNHHHFPITTTGPQAARKAELNGKAVDTALHLPEGVTVRRPTDGLRILETIPEERSPEEVETINRASTYFASEQAAEQVLRPGTHIIWAKNGTDDRNPADIEASDVYISSKDAKGKTTTEPYSKKSENALVTQTLSVNLRDSLLFKRTPKATIEHLLESARTDSWALWTDSASSDRYSLILSTIEKDTISHCPADSAKFHETYLHCRSDLGAKHQLNPQKILRVLSPTQINSATSSSSLQSLMSSNQPQSPTVVIPINSSSVDIRSLLKE